MGSVGKTDATQNSMTSLGRPYPGLNALTARSFLSLLASRL